MQVETAPQRARPGVWATVGAVAFVTILIALTLAKVASAEFPFRGGDEQGHFSYALHLAKTGAWWPDLAVMPLYDLAGERLATLNFINHPPLFYWVAAPVQEGLAAFGLPPAWLRAFTLGFSFAAFGVIAALARRMGFGVGTFAALAAVMAFLLVPTFAAFFNNDQFALLGGALACYGAARRVENRGDAAGLALVLAGVALCSVKLTALMMVGGFAVVVFLGDRSRRPDVSALVALALVGAACSVPYAAYLLQYGSPTPDTAGQIEMLRGFVVELGWDKVPHMSLAAYLSNAPSMFSFQLGQGPLVFLGFLAVCLAPLAAFKAPRDPKEAAASAVVRAAMIATGAVLVVHVAFAYRRYEALGWLGDLYPRYYFPLLGAYALGWGLFLRRAGAAVVMLCRRPVSAIRPQFSANRQG